MNQPSPHTKTLRIRSHLCCDLYKVLAKVHTSCRADKKGFSVMTRGIRNPIYRESAGKTRPSGLLTAKTARFLRVHLLLGSVTNHDITEIISPEPSSQVAMVLQKLLGGSRQSKVAESPSGRDDRRSVGEAADTKPLDGRGSLPVCHMNTKKTTERKLNHGMTK